MIEPIPIPISFLDWVQDEKYMRMVDKRWFKLGEPESYTYTSFELYEKFKTDISDEKI